MITNTTVAAPGRRALLKAAIGAGMGTVMARVASAQESAKDSAVTARRVEPDPVPASQGVADIQGTSLWYWDTGGNGEPVILHHPGTGSGLVWGYQQPVFAKAGYRVIGYSRRGYYGSAAAPPDGHDDAADDLENLAKYLKIEKFHSVGSGGGSICALAHAIKYPGRVLSLTLSCTVFGVSDAAFEKKLRSIRSAAAFRDLPISFRELSPAYRLTNPEGLARWISLEEAPDRRVRGPAGAPPPEQAVAEITWPALEGMRVPTLIMTGDADLATPPPVIRDVAKHIPGSETYVVPEAGHSAYWEQPDIFNRVVLDFMRRHKRS